MTAALRFGIVGLDHWYSAIPLARALASDERVELMSISHSDTARAHTVAADLGSVKVTDSIEDWWMARISTLSLALLALIRTHRYL